MASIATISPNSPVRFLPQSLRPIAQKIHLNLRSIAMLVGLVVAVTGAIFSLVIAAHFLAAQFTLLAGVSYYGLMQMRNYDAIDELRATNNNLQLEVAQHRVNNQRQQALIDQLQPLPARVVELEQIRDRLELGVEALSGGTKRYEELAEKLGQTKRDLSNETENLKMVREKIQEDLQTRSQILEEIKVIDGSMLSSAKSVEDFLKGNGGLLNRIRQIIHKEVPRTSEPFDPAHMV